MHAVVFMICIGIMIAACIAQIILLIVFRRSEARKQPHFHTKLSTELVWTFIPWIILLWLVIG